MLKHAAINSSRTILCSVLSLALLVAPASALTDSQLDMYSQNNILFYTPDCETPCAVSCVGNNGSDLSIIGGEILADDGVKAKLKEELTGISDGEYNAASGMTWDAGVEKARSMQLKNTVLFGATTNGDISITAKQINDLLDVVGVSRKLVIITPYTTSDDLQDAYEATTLQIKETAKKNQQIAVVDWAEKAKNAKLNFAGDVPGTDEAKQLLVDTIVSAIGGSCNSGEAIVSGSTPEEKLWSGLRSVGFTPAQTAGIMGNMAHESGLSPARWQNGKESEWGKTFAQLYAEGNKHEVGVGLVQFTYYKYFDILDKYYKEKAPDLLTIMQDPYKYSKTDNGSSYCAGECFLKKVDDATANRLYSTQITIIADLVKGKYKKPYGFDYSGYLKVDDVEACAEWWLRNYENPAEPEKSRGERISSAQKYYDAYNGKDSFGAGTTGGTTGANCGSARSSSAFIKYNFTDGQLRGIIAMAKHENGYSSTATANEISLMANLFESRNKKKYPKNEQGFIDYVRYGGWFASGTGKAYNENYNASAEMLEKARDILNNGNRTFPAQIVEHDCIGCGDIQKVSNDGVSFNQSDVEKYVRGKTKIYTRYTDGNYWVFYDWADSSCTRNSKTSPCGDPFGYYPNNPPDESFSADTTKQANSAVSSVDITWKDGWITGGMSGYVKGTPEMAGLTVTDSAPTMDYETNRPIDGKMGPNKILLHNTEGGNSVGQYGLDIYRGNPYPPHFTIDLKEKKVYQHYSVDRPAAGVKEVDRSAGVQIEIIGFSTEKDKSSDWYLFNSSNFGDSEWEYLAKLLVGISSYTGIKLESSVNWKDRENVRMTSVEEFKKYTGVLGHQHAPKNDHIDPGDVWSLIKKQADRLGANVVVDLGCEGGQTGQEMIADFEWMRQCDSRWGSTPYGKCGTTCSSGCGVVSFTMLAQALTKVKLDVAEVTRNAGAKGLHICGGGSKHSLPETLANDYGVAVEVLNHPSIETLNAKLRAGAMIWTCGKGSVPFTSGGHCIGIRGITAEGRWLIADSASRASEKYSLEMTWSPNDIYPRMNNFRIMTKK